MGVISDEVKDEIRQRADIVAIVGRHVQLRKSGHNHIGVCPFHADKTPSFSVNGDKGLFYCFGCGKKGDVFTFVMELEGKSFGEAMESLAAMTGVALPARDQGGLGTGGGSLRAELLRVNTAATTFFESVVPTAAGASTRAYLEKRGISEETRQSFRLGTAPDGWSALGDHLHREKIPLEHAVALGLIKKRDKSSGYYDMYRDRIVCPVMTTSGDVVGFSARRLSDDGDAASSPKYINSSESLLYKKSKLLFGLFQARAGMRARDRAIVVEGNFDVINMHQAGFTETVAPLGTALTEEQATLLRRLAKTVILFYDGDRAGLAAIRKGVKTLSTADLEIRVALVPAGEDPDSLIRQQGPEAVEALIAAAQPGIEYCLFQIWGEASQSADGKARALREAADLLAAISDATARDFAIGTFAAGLNVNEEALRRGLRRALASQRDPRSNASAQPARVVKETPTAPPPRRELEAMAFLADHPNLISLAEELNLFSYLTDQRLRDMYSAARNGVPLVSATPDDPTVFSHILSGAYIAIAKPENTLREIVAVLAKDMSLSHLTQARRGLAPDEERKRLLEIVNTRRQVD